MKTPEETPDAVKPIEPFPPSLKHQYGHSLENLGPVPPKPLRQRLLLLGLICMAFTAGYWTSEFRLEQRAREAREAVTGFVVFANRLGVLDMHALQEILIVASESEWEDRDYQQRMEDAE